MLTKMISHGSFHHKKTPGLVSSGCFVGIEKGLEITISNADWVSLRWRKTVRYPN